jgi:hypothetical protein
MARAYNMLMLVENLPVPPDPDPRFWADGDDGVYR